MQAKIKSGLILGSTLMIGVLIGALLFGWLVRDRMRHIPHPRHFGRAMERMIEPQDEAQRQAVREVIKRYQEELREIDTGHREALKAHMDSFHIELKPMLSERQIKRMERRRHRFAKLMGPWREGRKHRRSRRGPPPGEQPPKPP